MILTRAPMRITLGGGGTDLPSYYSKYGGYVISAALNKYMYIGINRRFEESIRVSYSKTEIVSSIEDIEHDRVREALRLYDIDHGIEIVSIADIPAHTGLGSSSSFATALLKGLHTYIGDSIGATELAEEACHLEIDILGEPIGKQDQYISSFGGLIQMDIDLDGKVEVTPVSISSETLCQLESNTLLFFTGIMRSASDVLEGQNEATKQDDEQVIANLHRIKQIGHEVSKCLEQGDLRSYGKLMDVHWRSKRNLSKNVTVDQVDTLYEIGMKKGALGGKLVGAGGGGFLMFYCEDDKAKLRAAMEEQGLVEMDFSFDFGGCQVIVDALQR